MYCHPDPQSFGSAIRHTALAALRDAGHELREIDLYAEGFNPVMSREERLSYLADTAQNIAAVAPHVQALQWAEGWLVIYPTWYYSMPAMLKGWLDRVWLPGVTFEVAPAKERTIRGKLKHLRCFVGITTSGSPWWWLKLIGDPGRSIFMKGLKPLYARGCRMKWLQLYNMNHVSAADREAFLVRVKRELAALR